MPFTAEQKKKYWAAKKDGYNAERRRRYNEGYTLEGELISYIRKHASHVDVVIRLGECPVQHFLKCKIDHVKRWLEVQFSHEMSWDNFGSVWKLHNIFSGVDMEYDSEKQDKMLNPSYLSPKRITRNDIEEQVNRAALWNTINEDAQVCMLSHNYEFEDERMNEQGESIARINKEAEDCERRKASAAKVLREKGCSEEQVTHVLSQDRYGAIAIMSKERLRKWLGC